MLTLGIESMGGPALFRMLGNPLPISVKPTSIEVLSVDLTRISFVSES